MSEIVIVDSGGANLASLRFALQRLGREPVISRDPARIGAASHVLLPGVGAAGDTMRRLRDTGLDAVIPTLRQPVLGICLGMQILAAGSEEHDTECLGLIPGLARRLRPAAGRPVPHMGWNRVQHAGSGLFADVPDDAYAYFVHSYALRPGPRTCASADYGVSITAAIRWRNFHGTQFHPERSGAIGARILANFLELPTCN